MGYLHKGLWAVVFAMVFANGSVCLSQTDKPSTENLSMENPLVEVDQPGASSRFQKVLIVVFENMGYQKVIANPTMKKIAEMGATFTQSYALGRPSQPNYIGMVAGSLLGTKTNDNYDLNDNHVGDSLEAAGRTWRTYAEDFPGNCFLGSQAGNYVRKHNPFMSFKNVTGNAARCANVINDRGIVADLKANQLADYNLWIPNLINDGHDGGLATLEPWAKNVLLPFLNLAASNKELLVIVTFDEGSKFGTNQIYTAAIGAGIIPGTVVNRRTTHIDILGLVQKEFGLPRLPRQEVTNPAQGLWP
ncbi:MAG: hypothetical protein JNM39_03525 [Bdellovibrionaceae bacterium]|nr:hypothetical protein [Pseudobdellovibrionaceae bacterium]